MTETSSSVSVLEDLSAAEKVLHSLSLREVWLSLLLLVVCCIAVRLLLAALKRVLKRSRISDNLQTFFFRIARFALYFMALLIVAASLGIPVSSLLAVFSLLGLAVSLALQSLLSNLFSGIYLLLEKPFTAGEYIAVNGIEGTVKEISFFQTHIRTRDNRIIMIPNSDISSATVTNFHRGGSLRIDVSLPASYDDAPEAVKAAISDCISSVDGVLSDPAPLVFIREYGDSNIIYTARLWCRLGYSISVREQLTDRIFSVYRERGISISYPQIVIEQKRTAQ